MSNATHRKKTHELIAWTITLAFFIIGDTTLTAAGIALGAVEINPTGSWLMQTFGLWPGILLGKTLTLGFVYWVYRVSPWKYRYLFPATLAFLGVGTVLYNSYIILRLTAA